MYNQYKINTKKKRFAFEIILLILTISISSVIFFIGNYIHKKQLEKYYEKETLIQRKLDSLNDNVFRNRYENLKKNEKINDYSYESYKKSIINDKDSSFRRIIYYRLCDLYSEYRNEKTFEEFVQQFEYDSINEIDEQINTLQLQNVTLSKQYPYSNEYHIILIIVLLIITYPLRLIYYLIKWSVNILKETEEQRDNKEITNSNLIKNDLKIDNRITNNNYHYENKRTEKNKSKLLNYFTFNDEYLNGISYLNRMIISWVTSIIFGIGLYLMLTTIYKRSKSLGFSKVVSTIYCVTIPSMLLLTFFLIFLENSETDFSDVNIFKSILFRLLLGLPHMILLFKNGTRKKIGKFEIHE